MESESFDQGHRHRLRERFLRSPDRGLQDYELLELLLTFSRPRRDVKPLAKRLLAVFGGINGVLNADREKLLAVPELGSAAAVLLKVVREIGVVVANESLLRRDLLASPRAVVNFARQKLGGMAREMFGVLYLTVQNELIEFLTMNEGTIDQVAVYPRRVIEEALARHAAGLILVHNHPSGVTAPSEEDKRLTRAIVDASRLFDVRVLDHIIVGGAGYFSFTEAGLL